MGMSSPPPPPNGRRSGGSQRRLLRQRQRQTTDTAVPASRPHFMTPVEVRAAEHAQAFERGDAGAGVDMTLPGGFASLAERREMVAELFVKGWQVPEIARTLGVSRDIVRADVEKYQIAIQAANRPNLEEARARALELHRRVQQEAWLLFAQLRPESQNKTKALDTIIAAEAQIMRIEGVTAPDAASAAANTEIQRVLMRTLAKVGGPALQREFLATLAREAQTQLGIVVSASLEPPAAEGDADNDGNDDADKETDEP